MALTLTLPVPPSSNRYWRHVAGRVVLSREARDYRDAVNTRVLLDGRDDRGLVTRYTGPVALSVRWYRARRQGDLDNRMKILADALQAAGVLVSDSQIAELHAYRDDTDARRPRIEVTICPLSEGR